MLLLPLFNHDNFTLWIKMQRLKCTKSCRHPASKLTPSRHYLCKLEVIHLCHRGGFWFSSTQNVRKLNPTRDKWHRVSSVIHIHLKRSSSTRRRRRRYSTFTRFPYPITRWIYLRDAYFVACKVAWRWSPAFRLLNNCAVNFNFILVAGNYFAE